MRNLLAEFHVHPGSTILGFREHIFTGSLSSLATYMALQEGCFVTLTQRVLCDPLQARLTPRPNPRPGPGHAPACARPRCDPVPAPHRSGFTTGTPTSLTSSFL